MTFKTFVIKSIYNNNKDGTDLRRKQHPLNSIRVKTKDPVSERLLLASTSLKSQLED